MLDLNLDIISSGDSSCDINNNNNNNRNRNRNRNNMTFLETAQKEESSGTSNSSSIIINNTEDENSSNDALIFDILKKENTAFGRIPDRDFTFYQLFPEKSSGLELNLQPGLAIASATTSSRPKWPKLAHVGSTNGDDGQLKVVQQKQPQVRKSRRGPRSRSSQYRGVTFYRRTGRWESHIWDCGKQVYLGGFDTAHAAARAYDRAAIQFRGVDADINFNLSDYEDDMKGLRNLSKEEFVRILRHRSTGFPPGSSKYGGVTLHKCGRWEARMGLFPGKKVYDKAAIKCNGREAVTNFEPSVYEGKRVFNPNSGGHGQDLDLSLGISLPRNDPKGKDNVADCTFPTATCGLSNKDRLVVYNPVCDALKISLVESSGSVQSLHGLSMASKNLPTWSGMYSGLFSSVDEARAKEKRVEAFSSSSPRFSSWPWQMNGNNSSNVSTMSQLSIAASSGFSASSATTFQLIRNSHSVNNLCFEPTTSTTNASRYYSYKS